MKRAEKGFSQIYRAIICLVLLFVAQWASNATAKVVEYLPRPLPASPLVSLNGETYLLDKLEGNVLLIHFWATWCQACTDEIKMLDKFQKMMRKERVIVIPISEDFTGPEAVRKFYSMAKLSHLPAFMDSNYKWFREMKAPSLPATFIVDVQGNNVALVTGAIDWTSEASVNMIKRYVAEKKDYNPDYMNLLKTHMVVGEAEEKGNGGGSVVAGSAAGDSVAAGSVSAKQKTLQLSDIETAMTPQLGSSESAGGEIKMVNDPEKPPEYFTTRRKINELPKAAERVKSAPVVH